MIKWSGRWDCQFLVQSVCLLGVQKGSTFVAFDAFSMRSVLCQCFALLFSFGGWVHDQNRLYVNTCALKRKVFHSVCQKLFDLSTCGLWHELVLPLWQLNMSFVSQENMTIVWNIHQQGGDDFNEFQWKLVDMIPRCYNILIFQTGYTVRAVSKNRNRTEIHATIGNTFPCLGTKAALAALGLWRCRFKPKTSSKMLPNKDIFACLNIFDFKHAERFYPGRLCQGRNSRTRSCRERARDTCAPERAQLMASGHKLSQAGLCPQSPHAK